MEAASKDTDVLGPPPSYDSVMYGTDAASEVTNPQPNVPPVPAQYPHAPYTYPVPPSYSVNPAYPGAASQPQYPIAPRTAIIQPTIVCANQQPQATTSGCRKIIVIITCIFFFLIIAIIAWNFALR